MLALFMCVTPTGTHLSVLLTCGWSLRMLSATAEARTEPGHVPEVGELDRLSRAALVDMIVRLQASAASTVPQCEACEEAQQALWSSVRARLFPPCHFVSPDGALRPAYGDPGFGSCYKLSAGGNSGNVAGCCGEVRRADSRRGQSGPGPTAVRCGFGQPRISRLPSAAVVARGLHDPNCVACIG